MRQFNYMPLGFVQAVELPLQLLLSAATSKRSPLHYYFYGIGAVGRSSAFVVRDRCTCSVNHVSGK